MISYEMGVVVFCVVAGLAAWLAANWWNAHNEEDYLP